MVAATSVSDPQPVDQRRAWRTPYPRKSPLTRCRPSVTSGGQPAADQPEQHPEGAPARPAAAAGGRRGRSIIRTAYGGRRGEPAGRRARGDAAPDRAVGGRARHRQRGPDGRDAAVVPRAAGRPAVLGDAGGPGRRPVAGRVAAPGRPTRRPAGGLRRGLRRRARGRWPASISLQQTVAADPGHHRRRRGAGAAPGRARRGAGAARGGAAVLPGGRLRRGPGVRAGGRVARRLGRPAAGAAGRRAAARRLRRRAGQPGRRAGLGGRAAGGGGGRPLARRRGGARCCTPSTGRPGGSASR